MNQVLILVVLALMLLVSALISLPAVATAVRRAAEAAS